MKVRPLWVLGDGVWARALAVQAHRQGARVTIKTRKPLEVAMAELRADPDHWPQEIKVVSQIEQSIEPGGVIVLAMASQGVAGALEMLGKAGVCAPIVCAAKGMSVVSGRDLLHHEAHAHWMGNAASFAYLSGPSFAKEVRLGVPTQVVCASTDQTLQRICQRIWQGPHFGVRLSQDVLGVGLCGVMKNQIALCAGALSNSLHGENSRAALICFALNELASLIEKLGGDRQTAYGVTGLGDVCLSAYSTQSRNFQYGALLQRSENAKDGVLAESAENVLAISRYLAIHGLRSEVVNAAAALVSQTEIKTVHPLQRLLSKILQGID